MGDEDLSDEAALYVHVMEIVILPWCREFLPELLGPKYFIAHLRGSNGKERDLYFATPNDLTPKQSDSTEKCIRSLLPRSLQDRINICFEVATVEEAGSCAEDEGTPMMGASISTSTSKTCTLGPRLISEQGHLTINCLHPFLAWIDEDKNMPASRPGNTIYWPGNIDKADSIPQVKIGELRIERSGNDCRRYHTSNHPRLKEVPNNSYIEYWLTTINCTGALQMKDWSTGDLGRCSHINQYGRVRPGKKVRITGRTSGKARGWVSIMPATISPHAYNNDVEYRAWSIEPEDRKRSIGIRGDSGSGVVDDEDNDEKQRDILRGMLWGHDRSKYPLWAFIIDAVDLIECIKDDHPRLGALDLEQCKCSENVQSLPIAVEADSFGHLLRDHSVEGANLGTDSPHILTEPILEGLDSSQTVETVQPYPQPDALGEIQREICGPESVVLKTDSAPRPSQSGATLHQLASPVRAHFPEDFNRSSTDRSTINAIQDHLPRDNLFKVRKIHRPAWLRAMSNGGQELVGRRQRGLAQAGSRVVPSSEELVNSRHQGLARAGGIASASGMAALVEGPDQDPPPRRTYLRSLFGRRGRWKRNSSSYEIHEIDGEKLEVVSIERERFRSRTGRWRKS